MVKPGLGVAWEHEAQRAVSMRVPGGADRGTQESAFEPQATDPVAYGYLSSLLGTCDD